MTTTADTTNQPDCIAVAALKRRTQEPNAALVYAAELLESYVRQHAAAYASRGIVPDHERDLRYLLCAAFGDIAYLLHALHHVDQGVAADTARALEDLAGEPLDDWIRDQLTALGVDVEAMVVEEEQRVNAAAATPPAKPARPAVVTLCGSTRFSHAFREANLRETLAGRIVLTIGCDMRTDADLFADLDPAAIERIKTDLDDLHKRKIDLADEILVLNVGGYIGDSTRSEIAYAEAHGKAVRWLEPAEGSAR